MATDWVQEMMVSEEPPPTDKTDMYVDKTDWASEATKISPSDNANQPIIEGRGIGGMDIAVTGFTSDEEELRRFLAQKLYPNEPIEKSVQRFGKRDGVLYHKGDDGKIYRAIPEGMSIGSALAEIARYSPDIVGGAVSMATAPMWMTGAGLGVSMAASGAAAAGTEYARQKAGDYMMGEASTGDVNMAEVARKGSESGLGHGIGSGIESYMARRVVPDINRFDPQAVSDAQDLARRTNVELSPAEQTGLRSLGIRQKWLSNVVETSDDMNEWRIKRDEQVKDAWEAFLDDMSVSRGAAQGRQMPPYLQDAEEVGSTVRETAKNVIEDIRQALRDKAKPIYEEVYETSVPFTERLEDILAKPIVKEAVADAREFIINDPDYPIHPSQFFAKIGDDGEIQMQRVPNMREWDLVKQALGKLLDKPGYQNPNTKGMNWKGQIVTKLKKALVSELDSLVPRYRDARVIYQEGSEDLTNALDSVLNILAETKDVNLLKAANQIFNPQTRSPAMVRRVRRAIEGKDPNAWQAIKRLYLSDVADRALRVSQGGEIPNPAGKLHQAFSQRKIKRIMKEAMTSDEWSRLNDLLNVYKKAASVPALRSDTEFNRVLTERERRASMPLAAKAVGAAKAVNPFSENFLGMQAIQDWLTERNMMRHAQESVDIITSGDPDAIALMKELRRTSPGEKKFLSLFGQLIARIPGYGIEQALDVDYEPSE